MADFESGQDIARIRRIQAQREQEHQEIERMKQKLVAETEAKVQSINKKFAGRSDTVEEQLKQQTIGLVTLTDFKRKRETLEALEAERAAAEQKRKEQEQQRAQTKRVVTNKLSFGLDDDSVVEDNTDEESAGSSALSTPPRVDSPPLSSGDEPPTKKRKLGKDPTVDTHFLPDKEREEREQKEREELRRKYLEEQERIKNEEIEITYSYYDGTGHRRTLRTRKGTTVAEFLDKVRAEFKELRSVSVDNLMFIKEDLIIPHRYSFYDLIVTKARGKSGPLFHFDVHEDIRAVSDATIEKDESHAAKVVERHWYEKNKHIFPASRWEIYDPSKKFEKYTIRG